MSTNGNGNGQRTFTDEPAVRRRVPLLLGIMGPSGSGKTMSALRLAAGIQKASGGETFVVDTESRRSLHYADAFKFRHVNFAAPFSPDDYIAVLGHCKEKGATTVVVDSMSHEHEGQGGVLEWHAKELERLGGDPNKNNFRAWGPPKQARRKLINTILQLDMNLIFCFRAKDKLKVVPGKQPESMGWMPIAGEEFLYEMTVNFLLPPASSGVPKWRGLTADQETFLKAPPRQFQALLSDPRSLDESIGEEMARWAAGAPASPLAELSDLLKKGGLATPKARLGWIAEQLGRDIKKPDDVSSDDIGVLTPKAREMAEAGI